MAKRGETHIGLLGHRLAERLGKSRPQSRFAEVTPREKDLLAKGSQQAIQTEQSDLGTLIAGGREAATQTPPGVVETIARANVMREGGLYRTWSGYLALDRMVMYFMGKPDMSRMDVGEFGPGNFTHDAAKSVDGLQQYQATNVVGYEKGPQLGITQAAITLHEAVGELPRGGYTVTLSEGTDTSQHERASADFDGSVYISGLAIEYAPELTMQLATEHAAKAEGKPAFAGNWDLLHGYFGASKREVANGRIAIRPTHAGKGELLASSILEAELLGQAVEEKVVVIGDPDHPEKGLVRERHQTFRHRLQFQSGVNAQGSSIIPDYSTFPEGELTVITSLQDRNAQPKVRLWATHYAEGTPPEVERISRVLEYTLTEMYEKAREAGHPLDAGGILRQPDLAPIVVTPHGLRRRGQSLTAVSLLQSETLREGYPDITMLGNILMLNRDVLEAMEARNLLTFVGENKFCNSAADLIQQFLQYREQIRRYGVMTVPNGVAAVSALNVEAAQLMQAA